MSSASESELGALHGIIARHLAEKIASGEASASDVSNAIKMLKDNNITCRVDEGSDLDNLQKELNKGGRVSAADALDLENALDQINFTSVQ